MGKSLFSALSIVSSLGKRGEDFSNLKPVEIEENNVFIIEGKFENINNMDGLLAETNGLYYFYSFNFAEDYKILKDGKNITFADLKYGDRLSVSYDGEVNLTYPPQLNNVNLIKVVTEKN